MHSPIRGKSTHRSADRHLDATLLAAFAGDRTCSRLPPTAPVPHLTRCTMWELSLGVERTRGEGSSRPTVRNRYVVREVADLAAEQYS